MPADDRSALHAVELHCDSRLSDMPAHGVVEQQPSADAV